MAKFKVLNPHYERHVEIIRLHKQGQSYAAIASKYGISKQRISQLVAKEPTQFFLRATHVAGPEAWRRTGREYVRAQVRERDNHTCQYKRCRRKWRKGERAFDVHHLNGLCGKKSHAYDRVADMPTLITYCHRHHMQQHTVRTSETAAFKHSKKLKDLRIFEVRTDLMRIARERGLSLYAIATMFNVKGAAVSRLIGPKR